MRNRRLRKTIRQFLQLCEGTTSSVRDAEATLPILLDHLALASHASTPRDPDTDVNAPRLEYEVTRAIVVTRFPNYGLYQAGGTEPDGDLLVGDAIDDICDIAADLSEVAWLWEHVGKSAALWQFHFSFNAHWGAHLRSLQCYIHATERAG